MLERLDATGIRRWADLGLAALGRHREEIDALNVFPVPDGDTGTNLYLTFEAAASALDDADRATADDPAESLSALARGALLGARGNSGIILSQIVRGFSEAFVGVEQVATGTAAAGAARDRPRHRVPPRRRLGVRRRRRAARGHGPHGRAGGRRRGRGARRRARASRRGRPPPPTPRPRRWPARPSSSRCSRRAGVVDAGGRGLVVILDALVEAVTGVRRDPGPTRCRRSRVDVARPRRGRRRLRGDVPARRRRGRRARRCARSSAELGDSRRRGRRRRAVERARAHRRRRRRGRGGRRGRPAAPDPGHPPARRRRPSAAAPRATRPRARRGRGARARHRGAARRLRRDRRARAGRTSRRRPRRCSRASRARGADEVVRAAERVRHPPGGRGRRRAGARARACAWRCCPTRSIVQTLAAVAVHDADAVLRRRRRGDDAAPPVPRGTAASRSPPARP